VRRTSRDGSRPPNGRKVVVVSYGLWQRQIGGNPNSIWPRLFYWQCGLPLIGGCGEAFFLYRHSAIDPFAFERNTANQGPLLHWGGGWKNGVRCPGQRIVEGDQRTVSQPSLSFIGMGRDQNRKASPLAIHWGDARSSLLVMLGLLAGSHDSQCASRQHVLVH